MSGYTYTSLRELPIALTVEDVGKVLGISRNRAYEVVNRPDFPKLKNGRTYVIPKYSFMQWMLSAAKNNLSIKKEG